MREIKFRAWLIQSKRIVHFDKFDYNDEYNLCAWKIRDSDISESGGTYMNLTDEVDDGMEVMQYTGIKDKNGKEIYEGDIVKALPRYYDPECIGVVEYMGMCFVLHGRTIDTKAEWRNTCTNEHMTKLEGIEVIGNIYENPELLEGIK